MHLAMAQSVARRRIPYQSEAKYQSYQSNQISYTDLKCQSNIIPIFSKQVEGLNRKTAQSTIKILEFPDFSPDLTHFLAEVNDFMPFLTRLSGLKHRKAPNEYETRPLIPIPLTYQFSMTTEWNGIPHQCNGFIWNCPRVLPVTSMVVRRRTVVHTLANTYCKFNLGILLFFELPAILGWMLPILGYLERGLSSSAKSEWYHCLWYRSFLQQRHIFGSPWENWNCWSVVCFHWPGGTGGLVVFTGLVVAVLGSIRVSSLRLHVSKLPDRGVGRRMGVCYYPSHLFTRVKASR